MRTYKIMQEKARQFNADAEVQAALAEIKGRGAAGPQPPASYSRETAERLKAMSIDVEAIAAQGLGYERLDQLATEVLLGAR
jgi:xylose isomerase